MGMSLGTSSGSLDSHRVTGPPCWPSPCTSTRPRGLSLNGLAKDTKYPSKGIAAGCGFATYLVQVLALPSLQAFRMRFPLVWLTMFIDDLLVQARHRREAQVVSLLSEAGAGLADIIETDWECRVAAHKSVIVGSSDTLCKSL